MSKYKYTCIAKILLFFYLFCFFITFPTEGNDLNISNSNLKVGDSVQFGTFEQDGIFYNGAEPIEWIILEITEDDMLLVSRYGLDTKPFFLSDFRGFGWEDSFVRTWLNNGFYQGAFTDDEKNQIDVVQLTTSDDSGVLQNGGNSTFDKVFLLSVGEANLFFRDDNDRRLIPTQYAIAEGAFAIDGYCYWWLRTPGNPKVQATLVCNEGDYCGIHAYPYPDESVVRPSIRVKIN